MNKSDVKGWFSKYLWVVQILLLLVGLLLIILSMSVEKTSQLGTALFALGTAILASTLLASIHSVLGTDIRTIVEETLGFQKQVYDSGLEKIHLYIGDESIYDRFWKAHTIDYMFNTSRTATTRYGNRLVHAIAKHGCKVRILISDPDSVVWQDKDTLYGLCPGTDIRQEVKDVITQLNLMIEELRQHQPPLNAGYLEVRKYSCVPTGSIVLVDGIVARHTPYLPYVHSSEVPVYDVTGKRGGGLFQKYQDAFNRVWAKAEFVLKTDFSTSQQG